MSARGTQSRVATGSEIGGYRIDGPIGEGGMGVVLRAHDPRLDRPVALKVLHRHLARDREFAERFVREMQMAARLDDPGIVQIYAAGEDGGHCFIAMQYVEGVELHELMNAAERLPMHVALLIVRDVAAALSAAHELEIIHRDIKPANVMVTLEGRVKVMDFGLARGVRTGQRLTETGVYLGTPEYSAPEQCTSDRIDQRADLYSLGVILYEMLAGIVPHTGDTPYTLFKRIVEEPPTPLFEINPEVPRPILDVVDRLLAKDPADRYQSAGELARVVDGILASFRGGAERAGRDLTAHVAEVRHSRPAPVDEPTLRLVDTSEILRRQETLGDRTGRPAPTFTRRSERAGWTVALGAAIVLLSVVCAVALAAWARGRRGPSPTPGPVVGLEGAGPGEEEAVPLVAEDGRIRVAVCDFQNLGEREELEWMRISLTEMLITNLTSGTVLNVLTRDRVQEVQRAAGDESPAALARRLAAGIMIRGHFLPAGEGRVRVFVQVIRGDLHLGSPIIEGNYDEVFSLVDQLSREVLRIVDEHRRSVEGPPLAGLVSGSVPDPGSGATSPGLGETADFDSARAYNAQRMDWVRGKGNLRMRPTPIEDHLERGDAAAVTEHQKVVLRDLERIARLQEEQQGQQAGSQGGRPGGDRGPVGGESGSRPDDARDEQERRAWRRVFSGVVHYFKALEKREGLAGGEAAGDDGKPANYLAAQGKDLDQCVEYLTSNRWQTKNADQLAIRSYGQAVALVEKPDASVEELHLALQLFDLAEELGHLDPKLERYRQRAVRRTVDARATTGATRD